MDPKETNELATGREKGAPGPGEGRSPPSPWRPSSPWVNTLLPLVVTLGLLLLWTTSPFGFGKSRAKLVAVREVGVSFDDVAGCEEAKQELREVIDFLKAPDRFTSLGAKIPQGVLLVGPPGTGKTLMARAVAGEAEVPFFSLSGSDFVEMFVGVGAARVRHLFEQAKQQAPCIVFIDELDAVGRRRGAHIAISNDERENTLNQLLVELDGFERNAGVILLAATNRPDVLDPALLRPGRFDRQIVLDAPDAAGREAILRVHARGIPLGDDVRKISIVPRGRAALGYTLQLPTGDHQLATRSELVDRLRGLLGGRVAEEIVFEEPSTGSENDLQQATAAADAG